MDVASLVVVEDAHEATLRRLLAPSASGNADCMGPAAGSLSWSTMHVFVETDRMTGLALRAEPVRVGGRLIPTAPVV